MKSKRDYESNATYIYRYSCHDQERELCNMEARQWFAKNLTWHHSNAVLITDAHIDVERSPYMKYKLTVWKKAASLEQLVMQLTDLKLDQTYKVELLDQVDSEQFIKIPFEQRRFLEQQMGSTIAGIADLKQPQLTIGVVVIDGTWFIGATQKHHSLWQQRIKKPRQYSTALSTSVARAIVNVAVPKLMPSLTLVDPCCGIGTVLLEACDMGINAEGYDINPLAVVGARENIEAYQYHCQVTIQDMKLLTTKYDAAILDLPYNHCSVLPAAERLAMLTALRTICTRAVIVSVEPIELELIQAGAIIIDKGHVRKTHFNRDIWLVEFARN